MSKTVMSGSFFKAGSVQDNMKMLSDKVHTQYLLIRYNLIYFSLAYGKIQEFRSRLPLFRLAFHRQAEPSRLQLWSRLTHGQIFENTNFRTFQKNRCWWRWLTVILRFLWIVRGENQRHRPIWLDTAESQRKAEGEAEWVEPSASAYPHLPLSECRRRWEQDF